MEVAEAIKYPSVTFASNALVENNGKLTIKGNLTFHGVAKPVELVADKKSVDDKLIVTGEFSLKLTDFNVDPPSLMGLATNDDFKLAFNIVF